MNRRQSKIACIVSALLTSHRAQLTDTAYWELGRGLKEEKRRSIKVASNVIYAKKKSPSQGFSLAVRPSNWRRALQVNIRKSEHIITWQRHGRQAAKSFPATLAFYHWDPRYAFHDISAKFRENLKLERAPTSNSRSLPAALYTR